MLSKSRKLNIIFHKITLLIVLTDLMICFMFFTMIEMQFRIEPEHRIYWSVLFAFVFNALFLLLWRQAHMQQHIGLSFASDAARLAKVQSITQTGDWVMELGQKKVWASNEALRLFGLEQSLSPIKIQTIQGLVCRDDRTLFNKALRSILKNGTAQPIEFKIFLLDNPHERSISVIAELELNHNGIPTKIIGSVQDITQRKAREKELKRQATIDGLTGIFNRSHFLSRANEELQRIHRYGGTCVLLMVDIDHFKMVNDNFGHAVGDTILQRITAICKDSLRSTDLPGRIGGEEFAILLLETELVDAKQAADRLRQNIEQAVFILEEGVQMPVHVSIGVAKHRSKNESLAELMLRADKALYRAKSTGRNRVVEADYEI